MAALNSTKKGSVLTCELYHLFQEYIRGGCAFVPDSRLLEAMASEPVNNAAKRKRLRKKFKSWAARLAVRPIDGRLVYKTTGKLIVPEEFFVPTIERKHNFNGQKHLTLSQTIDAIMSEYSVGKREFGIDRDLIVAVVNHCSHPDCQRAFFQRQHHRNNSQANAVQDYRKQVLSLKFYPQRNDDQLGQSSFVQNDEVNYGDSSTACYNLTSDQPSEDTTMDEKNSEMTISENGSHNHLKMSRCKHSHRFAPIQPRLSLNDKTPHVSDEKTHGSVKNPWHIPVRCIPVPRGISAVPRPQKTDTTNANLNLTEDAKLDTGDKPPVKVDELYLLLLKRIHMIRKVMRPCFSSNSARLQEVLRTYINDGIGIIQRLRHDVPVPPARYQAYVQRRRKLKFRN